MVATDLTILAAAWFGVVFCVPASFIIIYKAIMTPTRIRLACLLLGFLTACIACINAVRTTWGGVANLPWYKVLYFLCAVLTTDAFVIALLDLRRRLFGDDSQHRHILFWATIIFGLTFTVLTASYRIFFNPDYYAPAPADAAKRAISNKLYYVSTVLEFTAILLGNIYVFATMYLNRNISNHETIAVSIWYLLVVVIFFVLGVLLFILWLTVDIDNTYRKDALDCVLRMAFIVSWTFPPSEWLLRSIKNSLLFPITENHTLVNMQSESGKDYLVGSELPSTTRQDSV